MPRELWCRHVDCGRIYQSVAGQIPVICPHCERTASWTTVSAGPKPFRLTKDDVDFLKTNKIVPWEDDSDDGA